MLMQVVIYDGDSDRGNDCDDNHGDSDDDADDKCMGCLVWPYRRMPL